MADEASKFAKDSAKVAKQQAAQATLKVSPDHIELTFKSS